MFKKIIDKINYKIMGGVKFARYKGVTVGCNCRIYIDDWGTEPELISIGDKVTITGGVRIITHDGATWLVKKTEGRYHRKEPVTIGSNVFIGLNSILLPGIKICDNVIIGAGTIVTKSICEPGVYVGNPSRRIKNFEQYCQEVIKYNERV